MREACYAKGEVAGHLVQNPLFGMPMPHASSNPATLHSHPLSCQCAWKAVKDSPGVPASLLETWWNFCFLALAWTHLHFSKYLRSEQVAERDHSVPIFLPFELISKSLIEK